MRVRRFELRLIGLVPALKGLQREMAQSDLDIVVSHEDVPANLPEEVTLCLFRFVQEALNNGVKYSRARRILVHLICEPHALQLSIVDDGVGFDVRSAWGKGLGLVSMSERLEAIGGNLAIRSRPGAGTLINVKVPLPAMPDAETIAV